MQSIISMVLPIVSLLGIEGFAALGAGIAALSCIGAGIGMGIASTVSRASPKRISRSVCRCFSVLLSARRRLYTACL